MVQRVGSYFHEVVQPVSLAFVLDLPVMGLHVMASELSLAAFVAV